MPTSNERILSIESSPEICDPISRQVLQPLGYQGLAVSDARKAIQQVIKFTPDLINSNINLDPGRRNCELPAIKILCTDDLFKADQASLFHQSIYPAYQPSLTIGTLD
jgi:hypothetical protein